MGREQAINEIKRRTRNYAKRQRTWFKKDPRIKWFRVAGSAGDMLEDIEKSLDATARLVLEYMVDKLEN
jgi:tRNA dimethylallyltransferase